MNKNANSIIGHFICDLFLILFALLTTLPMVQLIAQSFSSELAVTSGAVALWPIDFNLDAYKIVLSDTAFYSGMFISVSRAFAGSIVSVFLTVLLAYPLSKRNLPYSGFFTIIVMLTMYFSPGLIPSFFVVKGLGLTDNFLVYIIPGAINAYNMMLMRNFIQALPSDLEDAARIDGCSNFGILFRVIMPLSKAMLATLLLFVAVNQWNAGNKFGRCSRRNTTYQTTYSLFNNVHLS